MAIAFQSDAFQNNAFQVAGDTAKPFVSQRTENAPKRTWVAAALAATWFNSVIMPEGPKPSAEQNLEVPGKQVRIVDRTQQPNLLLNTLSGAPPKIQNVDWGMPYRQIREDLTQYPNLQTSTLQTFPFVQEELGIGVRPRYRSVEDTQSRVLLDITAPVVTPFIPVDWSQNTRPLKVSSFEVQNRIVLELVSSPFTPEDWSTPKQLPRGDIPAYQEPLVLNLPPVPDAVLPFRVLDWRLPAFAWDKSSPQSWYNSGIMPLPTAPGGSGIPTIPIDWTRVPLKVKKVDKVDETPITLLLPPTPPAENVVFREALIQHVERVPKRIRPGDEQSRLVLEIVPSPPFFGNVQPNSKAAPRLDLHWTQNLIENTLGLGIIPPFSQTDWRYPNLIRAVKVLVNQDQGSIVVGPIPPAVVTNTGRSRYWKARQGIDWNTPFSFAEVIKPEIRSIDIQVKEQKVYKEKLIELTKTSQDFTSILKEIEFVEQKIKALLAQKESYYSEYFEFLSEYKADKQRQRELKKQYLASFKEQSEEDELLELIEMGVL